MIRKILFLLALGALAAALALPASAAAPATPGGTLRLEIAYLKAGQFQKLYNLYTPKFKATCPYSEFLQQIKPLQDDFQPVSLRITKTTIVGAKATLDYQFLIGGKVVDTTKGDVYVKIKGSWYDELDKVTTC